MQTVVSSDALRRALPVLLVLVGLVPTLAHGASLDPARPTVLITGSNRGIGLAFVEHYVGEGWNVVATVRAPERAAELNALAETYEHLLVERLDVTDGARIRALAGAHRGTAIDLLINNAGIHESCPSPVARGRCPASACRPAALTTASARAR